MSDIDNHMIDSSYADHTLAQLCDVVAGCAAPYEDVSECIEDKAHAVCCVEGIDAAVGHLRRITTFFEQLEYKNDENCGDLAEVYVLIGELYQTVGDFAGSLSWFEKAIIVNDRYDVPYHGIAASYLRLGDDGRAIKSLLQEITVAPGNYYTYLLLADLYERDCEIERFQRILEALLERDPENIRALHKLIIHYERESPELDVGFLRERIIRSHRRNAKADLMIWACHMCRAGRHHEALVDLTHREKAAPGLSMVHLLKAYVYGELGQHAKKRESLRQFKLQNFGKTEIVRNKLTEFASIFGDAAARRLDQRLAAVRTAG